MRAIGGAGNGDPAGIPSIRRVAVPPPSGYDSSVGRSLPAKDVSVLAWRCLVAAHDWRYGPNLGVGPTRWCHRCKPRHDFRYAEQQQ
jgi:hypothetical protein